MTATARFDPPGGLQGTRRHLALTGLWLGMAMSALDASVANIALPTIARDLSVPPATVTWVVTAYQIAVVMTLFPVAALAERVGYHRVYQAGLGLFTLMSLGCSFAPTLEVISGCRFLQGVGAAAMMGVNGAQMRVTWPAHLLARGIGYNALVISLTAAAGPSFAGFVLIFADWPWLFLINIPIGALALALVQGFGPRTMPVSRHFDFRGAALNAAMFGALFLAASEAVHGSMSLWLIAMLCLGGLSALLLLHHVKSGPRPLVPIDLIRIPRLRFAYAASISGFASQMCLLISLPFLLEGRLGLHAAVIGLLIVPLPIGVALAAPLGSRVADNEWAGAASAAGLSLMAITLLGLSMMIDPQLPLPVVGLAMALCGIGFGLFQVPNNNVMLRTGPLERAGAASAMLAQCRLVGQTTGALIAALVIHIAGPSSPSGLISAAALAGLAALLSSRRQMALTGR